MQTRNLDKAVRELRSQQDRLLQIKEHDAGRYACAPPGSPFLRSLAPSAYCKVRTLFI